MSNPQKTVFISYRRSVSSFFARAIFMDLRDRGYDVFMDVESIDSGTFDTIIMNQITARAHFIVILTPGSTERFADPGDWFRSEIEHAIVTERHIIPILSDGFSFNTAADVFKGTLAKLPRYNALVVSHDYFDAAMEKLDSRFLRANFVSKIEILDNRLEKEVTSALILPTPVQEQKIVERQTDRVDKYEEGAPRLEEIDLAKGTGDYAVFLSYRRSDTPYAAGHIYEKLVARLGRERIFKDVENIPLGVDFRTHIASVLNGCRVVLVLVGDRWLTATNDGGRRRLDMGNDFVRTEIETAFEKGISVIPVFLNGITEIDSNELPKSLKALAYRNGIEIRPDPYFANDTERLIRALERLLAV